MNIKIKNPNKLWWLDMKNTVFFGLMFLHLVFEVRPLENGLARTPPMGWMSWGYYRCNIDCAANPRMCLDESLIMRVADAFYNEGYQDAGYEYIIIDDCWSEKRRTKGKLVADKKRFPHGMKFLADYIHSKRLKFGMYLNLAEVTCMGVYPGSKGHLRDDAQSLAAWDVDYVKVDGCFNEVDYLNEDKQLEDDVLDKAKWRKESRPFFRMAVALISPDGGDGDVQCVKTGSSTINIMNKGQLKDDSQSLEARDVDYVKVDGCFNEVDYLNEAYVKLGRELRNTNRSIVYSCSWPYYMHFIHNVQVNFTSVMNTCNLWRNYEDINLPGTWHHVKQTIKYFQRSYYPISKYHGPGHWNDPDMLLVATGNLTIKQSRLQMAVYAMMSMPLLISCDMKNITQEEKELLLNPDLLALNQDPLGVMARPSTIDKDVTLWVKHHLPIKSDKYYSFSFAIVNFGRTANSALVIPRDYGLQNDAGYTVLDVFVGQYFRNTTPDAEFLINIPAEDVVIYTMYPI